MPNKKFAWAEGKARDWKNYLPPARPSTSELAVIEKYLVGLVTSNPAKIFSLAILGCTVEFRSLAHKYGMKITMIDFSKLHYEILSKQPMMYAGPENFIESDWRKMQTAEKFDVILGDLVVNMLNTADRDLLLRNVSEMLSPGGVFISRNWIKTENNTPDFAATVKLAREKYPNINFYVSTAGYVYPAYINETEFADVEKMKKDIDGALKTGLISKNEHKIWHDRLKYEIKGISAPAKEFLDAQISKYFKITDIREGIDVFSDTFKIYFQKKL